MAKTTFAGTGNRCSISTGVQVTNDFLNSIYDTDGGHKHDGASEDGHCNKINPETEIGFHGIHYVNSLSELDSATTAIGSSQLGMIIISDNIDVTSNKTYTENISFLIQGAGRFTISSGVSLTINGPFEAPIRPVFTCVLADVPALSKGKVKAIYPQWFGAKGDGATDDSNAFNKATKVAKGTAPLIVPKPASAYFIAQNTNILVGSDTEILGEDATIDVAAQTEYYSAVFFIEGKENVFISGLRIICSNPSTLRYQTGPRILDPLFNTTVNEPHTGAPYGTETTSFRIGIGIEATQTSVSKNIKIMNCYFQNMYSAFKIDNGGYSNNNQYIQIENVRGESITSGMMFIGHSTGVTVKNIYANGTGQCRVDQAFYIQSGIEDILLEGIHVKECYGYGISVYANNADTSNVIINDAIIDRAGGGVSLSGEGSGYLQDVLVKGLILTNALANVTGGIGISFFNNTRRITVDGFLVKDQKSFGVDFGYYYNKDITIRNGSVENTLTSGYSAQQSTIRVAHAEGNSNLFIENVNFVNCFCDGGHAVILDGSTSVANLIISDCNFIFDSNHAPTASIINFYHATTGMLRNLYFKCDTSVNKYAMWFSPSYASDFVVSGCFQRNMKGLYEDRDQPLFQQEMPKVASGAEMTFGSTFVSKRTITFGDGSGIKTLCTAPIGCVITDVWVQISQTFNGGNNDATLTVGTFDDNDKYLTAANVNLYSTNWYGNNVENRAAALYNVANTHLAQDLLSASVDLVANYTPDSGINATQGKAIVYIRGAILKHW